MHCETADVVELLLMFTPHVKVCNLLVGIGCRCAADELTELTVQQLADLGWALVVVGALVSFLATRVYATVTDVLAQTYTRKPVFEWPATKRLHT